MTYELSEGALSTIMSGGQVDAPTMQILGSKRISGAGDNERYRLLVSDGLHVNSFAMLATQLNDMIRNGSLSDNSIIKIVRFITSIVPNTGKGEKRVMIILDVEVLVPGSEVGHRIGSPTPLSADGQVPNAQAPNGQAPSRPAPAAAAPSPPKQNPAPTPQPLSHPAPSFGGNYGNNIRSPARNNRGMGGMGAGNMDLTLGASTHPIASLTPYQNRWVIKARVISKTPIRTWNNSRGEGKLFSFDLVDESGEIRCTAFRDQVDKFYDLLEVNKVYLISRCTLKGANKKYTFNNDYEMTATAETQILPVNEEDSAIPQVKYNFVPLASIENMESNAGVDVIGVAKSTGDVVTIITRSTNKELKKREVSLVDESGAAVSLTLWGQQAEDFDGSGQPVVAVKGGRVNEFGGGKSVSGGSSVMVNPDIEEAHRLRGWFDQDGANREFKSISQRTGAGGSDAKLMTLKEAQDQGIGKGDKPDYFSCKATVQLIKNENAMYMACQSEGCNKKVVDQQNGFYRCEKCNKETPGFNPRLLITMSIGDWSSHNWVTLFQESAETLLGHTAKEVHDMKENSPEMYLQVFQQATFKSFNFRLRAQVQNFQDEQRMKMTVVSLKPIDHVAYSKSLLAELKELTGMGSVNH